MLSFIVPAHNEQAYLGRTLQAIHDSARSVSWPYEVVVVDDASTDATVNIALQHGARVVSVQHRQIAATRNAGAQAARGERLFFVDADTTINPRAVAAALRVLDQGAAGGGAPFRFEGKAPLYAHLLVWWLGWFMRLAGITGGAFLFCTREAFRAVGGFDERLFGAEDAAMCWALNREGRFVVLWRPVLTSARRVQGIGGLRMITALFRMAFFPAVLTRRSSVGKVWYVSQRNDDGAHRPSLAVRALHGVLLLVTVAWITGPLWNLVPWSLTPPGSPVGEIRWGVAIFSCHVSLVLWPCAYLLFRNLLRQRRWIQRVKLLTLLAVSLCLAWSGTREVVWFWMGLCQWLAASMPLQV